MRWAASTTAIVVSTVAGGIMEIREMKSFYPMALLGLMLCGCGDYPGHKTNGGVKMLAQPPWAASLAKDISIGGDCHIDSIDGEPGEGPPSYAVKRNGAPLKVAGWAAIDARHGILAADVAVALRSIAAGGGRLFAAVSPVMRPDVAAYFKNPASSDTGFSVSIDLSGISPGTYLLEVIQHQHGRDLKCRYMPRLVVER